jgi:N,N-dimethylformamidase
MRPHHRFFGNLWGLAADLHLIDWLNARGFAHDVITDEDLHCDGAALLVLIE